MQLANSAAALVAAMALLISPVGVSAAKRSAAGKIMQLVTLRSRFCIAADMPHTSDWSHGKRPPSRLAQHLTSALPLIESSTPMALLQTHCI